MQYIKIVRLVLSVMQLNLDAVLLLLELIISKK